MLNDLMQFDDTFKSFQVNENGGNFEPLPDGKYQVTIQECGFEQSKNSGRPQFKWVYRVASGEYKGRLLFHYRGLDTPEGVQWFKQELFRSGFDSDAENVSLSDIYRIRTVPENLLDTMLEVQIKTNRKNGTDYQNVYVNRKIDIPLTDAPVF